MSSLRLDLSGAPSSALGADSPQPGDIYMKAVGPLGVWWVVAVRPCGDCVVLSLDLEGEITGAQRYRASYFAENRTRRIGFAELPATIQPTWTHP